MRCLLATLGKDSPGVNSALRAATRIGLGRGFDMFGARRGFHGIIEGRFWKLKASDVAFILGKGGSLLGQDTQKRGNLNLLAADGTNTVTWRCHPREKVVPLIQGVDARAGGLDPLPFFKANRGIVSGYRPLAAL